MLKKCYITLEMSAPCLIHQRPLAISDEPVWSNKQSCCWSTACKYCTHMYHFAASGNHLSYLEAGHPPPLPENVPATWGEVALSESSVLHWFCLYANDSMSDNLQSQLMPFKPADRMTTFISQTFNGPCFTRNLQSATEEITQVLHSFSLFIHR